MFRQVVKIKVVVAKCKRGLIAVRKQSVSSIRLQYINQSLLTLVQSESFFVEVYALHKKHPNNKSTRIASFSLFISQSRFSLKSTHFTRSTPITSQLELLLFRCLFAGPNCHLTAIEFILSFWVVDIYSILGQ